MPGTTSRSRRRSGSETLCPDGLLGLAMKTTSGLRSTTAAIAVSRSRPKSSARGGSEPFGAGAIGDDRVHRVGRDEPDRAAAGPTESLQQLLQDLVGTIGGP